MQRKVLANGCFDPFHYGHLQHFLEAVREGEVLIVSVTSDEAVRREKGERRPLFKAEERAAVLRQLRCVHYVVIVDRLIEALSIVRPHVLVKGPDYAAAGIDAEHAEYCKRHRIEVRFTEGPKWSATEVGNELRLG